MSPSAMDAPAAAEAGNSGGPGVAGAAGPDPAVTASGRLIAAWRALETAEQDPLFTDPLAADLAGPEAVEEATRLARPWPPAAADGSGGALAGQHRRRFCVSNVGARVWWFDRQLLSALSGATSPQSAAAGATHAPPRQVVVLGAGYDTRPWRLDLPPGVAWFEVDLPEVAAAKRQALSRLGASFEPAAAGGGAANGGDGGVRHPLRAASWAGLSADLCRPGVAAALARAGLDFSRPVAWLVEGLLMYLTAQQVDALLGEIAAASPPGSVLLAHNSSQELIEAVRSNAPAYAPFPPELVATWVSGFPLAPERPAMAARLAAAGWPQLHECTSRARIAAQLFGGEGKGRGPEAVGLCCDFEARPDVGRDRWAVFVVASK